jgi:hypothetical protein
LEGLGFKEILILLHIISDQNIIEGIESDHSILESKDSEQKWMDGEILLWHGYGMKFGLFK